MLNNAPGRDVAGHNVSVRRQRAEVNIERGLSRQGRQRGGEGERVIEARPTAGGDCEYRAARPMGGCCLAKKVSALSRARNHRPGIAFRPDSTDKGGNAACASILLHMAEDRQHLGHSLGFRRLALRVCMRLRPAGRTMLCCRNFFPPALASSES